jgi:hypothetical protein
MAVVDVRSQGATGDGATDDHAAIMAAIRAAHAAGGGTVLLPAGDYALSAPLGNGLRGFSRVCLTGDGDRASTIKSMGNFAPITGSWIQSRIENLVIDANSRGGPGLVVDLDKSYVRHCWVRNWSGYGIRLNPNVIGLLNWIDDNFIEQCDGFGIHTTYQFYDSWIVNNNIGSTGPNLSVESGPLRILANHLNGAPVHNIELRGNKSVNIVGNICEGSGREAIVYTMPDFLDTDSAQVQIVGNNITNGGKGAPNSTPAIGIYARDAVHRTGGFNITGNVFACEDHGAGWSYAVDAEHVDNLAVSGNQWENNGFTHAAVRASGNGVAVAGNTSGNRGVPVVRLLAGGEAMTLPAAAAGPDRYTVKNVGVSAATVRSAAGQTIDGKSSLTLAPLGSADLQSDGSNWWVI